MNNSAAFIPKRGFAFVTCLVAFGFGVIYGTHRYPMVVSAAAAKRKEKEEREKKEREALKNENLLLKQQIEKAKRYFGESEFERAIAMEEKPKPTVEEAETTQSLFNVENLNRASPDETNIVVEKWIRALEEKPDEVVDKGVQ
jgi:hypothetical protein